MPMPYEWQDKTDPGSFGANWEAAFKHYRSEYDRLLTLSVESRIKDRDERAAMRVERDHAAARMVAFSYYIIP
jgi:hypothetical protein